MALTRTLGPKALALSFLCAFAGSAAANVYHSVEVRGAVYIPRDDIIQTCGPLTGVELDHLDLAAIKDCLLYTGVFDDVKVTAQGQTLIIEVAETETSPGRVDLGLAYVMGQGLTGTLNYEQFNLIPDTYLSIRNSFHREVKGYEIAVLRKDIAVPGLHFGLNFAGQRSNFDDRSYSTRLDQVEVFLGKDLRPGLRADLGLGYRDQRLFDLEDSASTFLRSEAGSIYAPFVHAALSYRSDAEAIESYHEVFLDGYLWNLGTSARLLDLRLEASARYSLTEKSDLHLGLRGGVVRAVDDQAPRLMDRGFLGGDSLRGFASRGIGPKAEDEMLGGDNYLMASVEVQREMGKIGEQAVKGGLFLDAGSVWSLSSDTAGVIDDKAHLRASLGVSLNMVLGGIPLQAYIAKPVKSRSGDDRQAFGLIVQARF